MLMFFFLPIQHVNEETVQSFENVNTERDEADVLEQMNSLLLPCLSSLTSFTATGSEDEVVAEIKNKWCMFLSNDQLSSK